MGVKKGRKSFSPLWEKISQKTLFFPPPRKREAFFKSLWTQTILLFRVFRAKVLFHFSRARHLLSVHPRKKNLERFRRSDTKARHPRRDPREKTNARTKKRPHGNASGCLKKKINGTMAPLDERDLRGKDGAVENAKSSTVERHHRHRPSLGVAVQTPRGNRRRRPPRRRTRTKKRRTVREAIQRLCVRSFRSSSSLVYYAGVDIVSIFDEERDLSVSSQKLSKTRDHIFPET